MRDSGGRRLDVVWPAGFTATETESGPHILDPTGSTVVRSGSSIQAGGGYIPANGQPCVTGKRDVFHIQSELTPLQ